MTPKSDLLPIGTGNNTQGVHEHSKFSKNFSSLSKIMNNKQVLVYGVLRHWRRFGVFIVNFEHILHLVLVFLLLTLNM